MYRVTAITTNTTTPAAVSTVERMGGVSSVLVRGTEHSVNSSADREQLTSDFRSGSSTVTGVTRMLVSADGTNIRDVEWRKRFYLVRYDARGHGKSGKPEGGEGWEWKRFTEDFDAVVQAFGVWRPFVVGWSLGASHLMDILTLHPVDYVAGIINIAGMPFLDGMQMERLATVRGREYINRMMVSPTVEEFQSGVQDFVGACCGTLSDEVRERCFGRIMTMSRQCVVRSLTRKQRVETFDEVGKTMLPCLLILGDKDEMIVAEELPKVYKAWRNFTLEVVEGGSHVPWTKTQRDHAAVFRWIDSVVRSWN